jgi:hypothetical protein
MQNYPKLENQMLLRILREQEQRPRVVGATVICIAVVLAVVIVMALARSVG